MKPLYSLANENVWKNVLKYIFPPECLHCQKLHDTLGALLCQACLSLLETRPTATDHGVIVTFQNIGPAPSLLVAAKKRLFPKAISFLAAWMALQYGQSSLSLPDLIIPVPSSWWRNWQTGSFVQKLSLALGSLLNIPVACALKRTGQLLRQSSLSREERCLLSSREFQWKKKLNFRGQTLLLLDDTITTGTTLKCCAQRLYEASPAKIIKMVCLDQGFLQE